MSVSCRCFCGKTTFSVEGEPAMQLCCHCDDCRRWGGGAFQAAKLFPADKVKLADGAKTIGTNSKTQDRKSCAHCGGALFSDMPGFKMVMVPAGMFVSEKGTKQPAFTPTFHIQYDWRILDVKDGLPKYHTLPKSMGGDDKLCAETDEKTK